MKPARIQDKMYLAYIKGLPCLCRDNLCIGDIVPHHTKTKGSGGSDYLTVPLCGFHHAEVHSVGRTTFQRVHNINFTHEIIRISIIYRKQTWGDLDPEGEPIF